MLARVVSKWMLFGTKSPFLTSVLEQDPLGRPSLVGGDDVGESEDVPDGVLEVEEVPAPA